MPDDIKEAPKIIPNDNNKSSSQVSSKNDDTKYPIKDLIENSKALTGQGKQVAVGALFNCKEEELTKDEFKKKIDEFLKKEVK